MELANMVRWDALGKFLQDHEAFSRKLIDLIALTLEVERVSLMLIDEKTQRMRIAYAKGLDEEVRKSVSTKVGGGISGWGGRGGGRDEGGRGVLGMGGPGGGAPAD